MHPKDLNITDFQYELNPERIAQYPVEQRDNSKLVIASENIQQDFFYNIDQYIPSNSLMIFNDTKVIHARLEFKKTTGARIEIFLLNPTAPFTDMEQAFSSKEPQTWNCLVGNLKKWKGDSLLLEAKIKNESVELQANLVSLGNTSQQVKFSWSSTNITFAELIQHFGVIPLPPYMNRKAEADDLFRYQTVYANKMGSVAAPTAGLHFTEEVFKKLEEKNISKGFVTLDVGAGTFKPVSSAIIGEHEMHTETVYISLETIQKIKQYINNQKIIAVGTTTTRTLESMFWFANKLRKNPKADFFIDQWAPYDDANMGLSPFEALEILENHLISIDKSFLEGKTQLIIAPSYRFKFIDILITNFHQPSSTLLLLVAAFYGEKWKDVYDFALKNNFRFLSYGDSCLFIR
ncbi:MAG: S-adenosylmethionine:tRNA ribosyltransferase-isomerase [Bacteroidales bacterium]|nr:S-adenosylmethionine:tRNA ribosyltransferase-isomerase [Bacteroidales bacterium]